MFGGVDGLDAKGEGPPTSLSLFDHVFSKPLVETALAEGVALGW